MPERACSFLSISGMGQFLSRVRCTTSEIPGATWVCCMRDFCYAVGLTMEGMGIITPDADCSARMGLELYPSVLIDSYINQMIIF